MNDGTNKMETKMHSSQVVKWYRKQDITHTYPIETILLEYNTGNVVKPSF